MGRHRLSIEWWYFNDLKWPLTWISKSRHFWSRLSENVAPYKDKVSTLIGNMPDIRNGTMFGDLDWPLNASRGLSAIAEFLILTRKLWLHLGIHGWGNLSVNAGVRFRVGVTIRVGIRISLLINHRSDFYRRTNINNLLKWRYLRT